MVLGILASTLAGTGLGFLLNRFGGGSGGGTGDLLSPSENILGAGNVVNRSTNSSFYSFSPQSSSLSLFAPTVSEISGSPNARIYSSPEISASQSPTQSTSPIFIPTGAGGEFSAGTGGGGSAVQDFTGLLLVGGAVALGIVLLKGGKKK